MASLDYVVEIFIHVGLLGQILIWQAIFRSVDLNPFALDYYFEVLSNLWVQFLSYDFVDVGGLLVEDLS